MLLLHRPFINRRWSSSSSIIANTTTSLFLFIFLFWTHHTSTFCKPLQQQSNDRSSSIISNEDHDDQDADQQRSPPPLITADQDDDDDEESIIVNDNYNDHDYRRLSMMTSNNQYNAEEKTGRGRASANLHKLKKTIDELSHFRRMIDNRLLINNRLTEIEDDDDEAATDNDEPPPPTAQHHHQIRRYHHHQNHQQDDGGKIQIQNQAAARRRQQAYHHHNQREQRRDPVAAQPTGPATTTNKPKYRILQGLNIKARLQPDETTIIQRRRDPSATTDSSSSNNDDESRYLSGRTTGLVDEQQLRIFSQLAAQEEFDCPRLNAQTTQVLCPSRGRHGYRVCIPDSALCNNRIDCPNGEDEDPVNCLFYKTTIHHFRLVVNAVVDLSDLVKEQEIRRDEL